MDSNLGGKWEGNFSPPNWWAWADPLINGEILWSPLTSNKGWIEGCARALISAFISASPRGPVSGLQTKKARGPTRLSESDGGVEAAAWNVTAYWGLEGGGKLESPSAKGEARAGSRGPKKEEGRFIMVQGLISYNIPYDMTEKKSSNTRAKEGGGSHNLFSEASPTLTLLASSQRQEVEEDDDRGTDLRMGSKGSAAAITSTLPEGVHSSLPAVSPATVSSGPTPAVSTGPVPVQQATPAAGPVPIQQSYSTTPIQIQPIQQLVCLKAEPVVDDRRIEYVAVRRPLATRRPSTSAPADTSEADIKKKRKRATSTTYYGVQNQLPIQAKGTVSSGLAPIGTASAQGIVPMWVSGVGGGARVISPGTLATGTIFMVPPSSAIAGPSNQPQFFTFPASPSPLINLSARPISTVFSAVPGINLATAVEIQSPSVSTPSLAAATPTAGAVGGPQMAKDSQEHQFMASSGSQQQSHNPNK
ncbi:hypothetical protein H6P81_006107 [Aristolochia fimbriata]|uniref:Uncharacterized protein n=1 Tax=Aristolochia fimbriata TaxID=158543 RepID=A0AAV7EWK8_ARIFI|nr:hypothetical protein H6P81_006107 [Aristolochia fimbriata]